MDGLSARALGNLLAATDAGRNNRRVQRRFPHSREKPLIAYGHRHLEMLFLESERTGHAATT